MMVAIEVYMKKDHAAKIITALVILLALGIVVARKRGLSWQRATVPAANTTPQDAIYGMLDAARLGNGKAYLASYTGAMEANLAQAIAEKGEAGFRGYLKAANAEINEALRAAQRAALAGVPPTWHERFEEVPAGPLLLIANEFFDALPVRQFEKTGRGWSERMVGLAQDGETLTFALAPGVSPLSSHLPEAKAGAQAEICEAGRRLASAIGARLKRDGGWALIIDYGYDRGHGASLQAVRGHRGAGIFDHPGETDLSAHVDFAALANATGAPARITFPRTVEAFRK